MFVSVRHIACSLSFALLLVVGQISPAFAGNAEKYHGGEEGEEFSANQYVTLDPLIVPMVDGGRHTAQYILIISLELDHENDRDDVRELTPRLRSELYETLFGLVTYRTAKPRIPHRSILRDRLYRVARSIAGDKNIKSLIIRHSHVDMR